MNKHLEDLCTELTYDILDAGREQTTVTLRGTLERFVEAVLTEARKPVQAAEETEGASA